MNEYIHKEEDKTINIITINTALKFCNPGMFCTRSDQHIFPDP